MENQANRFKFKGPRAREADDVTFGPGGQVHWSLKAREPETFSSMVSGGVCGMRRREGGRILPLPFCSVWNSSRFCSADHSEGRASPLSLQTHLSIFSGNTQQMQLGEQSRPMFPFNRKRKSSLETQAFRALSHLGASSYKSSDESIYSGVTAETGRERRDHSVGEPAIERGLAVHKCSEGDGRHGQL